jgi:hypothetical protein
MAVQPKVAKVRDLLLKSGLIDELSMRSAMGRLEQWGGRLPKVLADMGMANEENIAQVLAAALRLPVQMLGTVTRDGQALARLDVRFCEEHAVFPVSLNTQTRTLTLAVADPTAIDVVDQVSAKVNARVQVVVSTESQILAAIARYYRGTAQAGATTSEPQRTSAPMAMGALELELDTSAPEEIRSPTMSAVMKAPPSANTMLDEMMGEDEKVKGFTPEELIRVGNLRLNHERTTAMLRAVQELLREKGLLR